MSPARRSEDGVRRARQRISAPPGGRPREESWPGANDAKAEKLGVRSLRRRAVAQGLQLRHSDYGYALIDAGRKPVDGTGMTLAEVEFWLEGA